MPLIAVAGARNPVRDGVRVAANGSLISADCSPESCGLQAVTTRRWEQSETHQVSYGRLAQVLECLLGNPRSCGWESCTVVGMGEACSFVGVEHTEHAGSTFLC